jgi:carboxymethylenebutenolidase
MPELRSIAFTSGDGATPIPSYLAMPDGAGPHPTVLILRGVAGPDDGYTEIAERLAGLGDAALMHGWKIRGNDPPDDLVYADMQGTIAYLHSAREADMTRLAVFGFCRGGVRAFMAARAHDEVRAIVVFHGFAFRSPGAQPGAQPYDLVEAVNVPAPIMHRTEDEQAPLETMQRMEARMRTLGQACAFTYYFGARHGFGVRTHPGYEAAAATRSFEEARHFLDLHFRKA